MTLKENLKTKFVYVDQVADILDLGMKTKKNVFLYGRGGHAKSQIIEEFLKHIDPTGEESFVQACGEGLTTEKLFGGMNLKKFQDTGEVEYLVKNSFMNKKYVVFEELLDSRMNVLLELKDILTSGKFRQGSQQFPIRTEFIVVLTNRTKQEVAEDNSVKALLERFPLEMKLEWNSYDSADYSNMFEKVLKNRHETVADVCATINEHGDFISPRTAIHMAEVYTNSKNINDLVYFGSSTDIIEKMKRVEKERKEFVMISGFDSDVDVIIDEIDSHNMASLKTASKLIKEIYSKITNISYTDKAFPSFQDVKDRIESLQVMVKNDMINLLENE